MSTSLGTISIVIPTYKEVSNIESLLKRLDAIRKFFSDFQVLIMDDNSQDGTEELVKSLGLSWAHIVVRHSNRGLSPAVIDGLKLAKNDLIVVMDADLSHPPEVIPEMANQLVSNNADFVVGSRYIAGGKIDQEWSWARHINSQVATALARPFTNVKDPMSGFFALKRQMFLAAKDLNPIGYKIGLELLVKTKANKVTEVPITFADRVKGESKLNLKEQLNYIRHIKRLFDYKFGNLSYFIQFAISGAIGLIANILLLNLFLWIGSSVKVSVGLAIFISMAVTFVSNRKITFNHGVYHPWASQYFYFVAASSLGALINWKVTTDLIENYMFFSNSPSIASVIGVLAGMISNFTLSRYFIFKKSLLKKT